jgi:hypothetical protein
MNSLMHDKAFLLSLEMLGLIKHLLREEEHRDAFETIFECVKKHFEDYETKAARRLSRLEPGRN